MKDQGCCSEKIEDLSLASRFFKVLLGPCRGEASDTAAAASRDQQHRGQGEGRGNSSRQQQGSSRGCSLKVHSSKQQQCEPLTAAVELWMKIEVTVDVPAQPAEREETECS